MSDIQAWKRGGILLAGLRDSLTPETMQRLDALAQEYRTLKTRMAAASESVGGAALCKKCGGQCCLNGKYRMNCLDAYAHLACGTPLPDADFGRKPLCPYSGDSGCLMEAGLRPISCIQFVCEELEKLLPTDALELLGQQEQRLRELLAHSEILSGFQLSRPLLMAGECLHDRASMSRTAT